MGRTTRLSSIVALAALVGLSWSASDAAARMVYGRGGEPLRRPGASTFEFVIEGGLVEPLGEHADDFGAGRGLGAGTGFELGLRLRQQVGDRWAVSPVIHYAAFGKAAGVDDFAEGDGLAYEVATSLLRYGVDLQFRPGPARAEVRPFLSAGVALVRNRYRDSLQYYQDFTTSMNGPSWTAGAGIRLQAMEISANYVWNRFDSANLEGDGVSRQNDWDYATLRIGFAFGSR